MRTETACTGDGWLPNINQNKDGGPIKNADRSRPTFRGALCLPESVREGGGRYWKWMSPHYNLHTWESMLSDICRARKGYSSLTGEQLIYCSLPEAANLQMSLKGCDLCSVKKSTVIYIESVLVVAAERNMVNKL